MRDVDLIALAGLLHDIGKFGQRAEIDLDDYDWQTYCPNYNGYYSHKHAAYTAKILGELVEKQKDDKRVIAADTLNGKFIDISAMHHKPETKEEWIVAAADRLASGFERDTFEEYNEQVEEETKTSFKEQQLNHLFDEDKKFPLDKLEPENIFPTKEKGEGYKELWKNFEKDLKKIKSNYPEHLKAQSLEYLLKKYTSFIPSATSFKFKDNPIVKPNIPLYEHLKTTSIFAAAIAAMDSDLQEKVISYYKDKKDTLEDNIFLLIAGDFFGIQNFIFDEVQTKYAAKTLRAKSAYIQLLIKVLAFYVCQELEISPYSIISTHAGKFEILVPNTPEIKDKLKNLQNELNNYFAKEFFGQTGVGLAWQEACIADFLMRSKEKNRFKELRKKLGDKIEEMKLQKFNLFENGCIIFDIDKDLSNQNQCNFCHKRKGEKKDNYIICNSCERFVKIGQNLTKFKYIAISTKPKDQNDIKIFKDFYLHFFDNPSKELAKDDIYICDISKEQEFAGMEKWELSSYVKTKDNEIVTLEDLAKESVIDGKDGENREFGVEAIMALKGDGDGMGNFIRESDVTDSFAKYNFFARMVDYYFSVYVPEKLMKDKPLYTVFAGGDDIFVLGAWDSALDFAKRLREDFMRFAEGSPLSISVGMVMTKAHKPVSFIAGVAEEALESAKELEGKDAISLFGETVKWSSYKKTFEVLQKVFEDFDDPNTATLYRLLDFCKMSKEIGDDIKNSMWKSKLNYLFKRNVDKKYHHILGDLSQCIEKNPKETKMFLSEFIYKRRKQ
jgi:CRISPR-associated protein Csm1